MKYALIQSNKVVNVIEANSSFIPLIINNYDHIEPLDTTLEQYLGVGIGWLWTKERGFYSLDIIPQEPINPVPQMVSMRQARLALLEVNLLDNIEQILNSLSEPMQSEAKIEWEYATEVRRDWPTLNQIAQYLNLTSEYVDELFILASTK